MEALSDMTVSVRNKESPVTIMSAPPRIEGQYHLPLTHLSCAGCVRRAETALANVPGVTTASVNLATSEATIEVTDNLDMDSLRQTMQRAGYPVRETQLELDLEGMSCASCVARVERALMAHRGVLRADVNLATQRAQIDVIAGSVEIDALISAVSKAGYAAKPVDNESSSTFEPDRTDPEARALRADLMLASALTVPVFVLEMGGHVVPAFHHWLHHQFGMQTIWIVQFVLTTLVLFGPGRRFFTSGVPALFRAAPDMNSLVAIGTFAAWAYSSVATFAPIILPETARAVYFEAAAVIVTLILLGRWLELRAKGRTGAAIARLVGLQPRTARVERVGQIVEIAISEVIAGDIVHLRPGERVPADGILMSSEAVIDESMITGEPMPVTKLTGATLVGGTVNGAGALQMQVTRTGAETVLSQIIRMVQTAQGAKLPVQALVDRVTLVFVPLVMAIALITVLVWLVFGPDLSFALIAGVSVLIIACPCAMGLATPTSVMVGTGRGAELGVLFRKGTALQVLDKVKIVAFDKTGTLTEGRPVLTDLQTVGDWTKAQALGFAAALEQHSEHPVARAILSEATAQGIEIPTATDFASLTGLGVSGFVDQRKVLLGAARLMTQEGVDIAPLSDLADALAAKARSPLFLAVDGQLVGLVAVADQIKKGARDMVAALKARGIHVTMISGDARAAAMAVGSDLGIEDVVAEVMPDGKVRALEQLRDSSSGPLAFVGDGINDAPALAKADVGIAIGSGTDIAVETADVVLMSSAPSAVLTALDVSSRTMRNIRQNLFWAFAYNTALIPVAAGVLFPAFGILLSPMLAAGAMALSSVCVVSNALRLRRMTPVDLGKVRA